MIKVMKMIVKKSNKYLFSSFINLQRISINNKQSHKQYRLKNHNKKVKINQLKFNPIIKKEEIRVNLNNQKHPKSNNSNLVSSKEAPKVKKVKIKRREIRTKIKTNKRTD